MNLNLQKALAIMASVASVLAGVVTIASYLSGEDVTLQPSSATAPSESRPIIIQARAVFVDDDKIYILDYDNNLIEWNESLEIVML